MYKIYYKNETNMFGRIVLPVLEVTTCGNAIKYKESRLQTMYPRELESPNNP